MSKKIRIRVSEARKRRGPYKTPAEKSETKRKADARRRSRKFTDMALEPHKELRKLGRGIVEDAIVTPETGSVEIEEANPYHDKDGFWSSEEDATCKSTFFSTGDRKSVNSTLSDKSLAGRGKTPAGPSRYRCKDNSRKYESLWREYVENTVLEEDPVTIPDDKYDIARKFQEYEKVIDSLKRQVAIAKKKKLKSCPLDWYTVAKIIDVLERSSKGDLFPKKK